MANIMDLFSQAEVVDVGFDISSAKGIYKRIKDAQDAVGGRPTLKAKVGAGGINVFQFVYGNKKMVMPSFRGIIIAHHKSNALFRASADEAENANTPPICSSTDGVMGIVSETGECRRCEECPNNVFGSSGRGKACKNMHRLYILAEGCPIPVTLSIPPTSLELWRNYAIMDIAAAGLDMSEVLTEFTLTSTTSESGKEYSLVNFKIVGKVNQEVKDFCQDMGNAIDVAPRLAITGDEYNREPVVLQQADEDEDDTLPDWSAEQSETESESAETIMTADSAENKTEPEEIDFDSL